MGRIFLTGQLKRFTEAYMECALWCSIDDNGALVEDTYTADDLAPVTRAQMVADCTEFWNVHHDRVDDANRAGQDFWLTRNWHGAGFWDGDYPEHIGEILTDASHDYGSFDLYVDDNGLVSHY